MEIDVGREGSVWSKVELRALDAVRRIVRRQSTAKRSLNYTDIDLGHFHHRIESAFGSSRVGVRNGSRQNHRNYLPRHTPLVLTPTTSAFLTIVTNDCVPITIRFGLIIGCDLERKSFALRECSTTVESEAWDTHDSELHGQNVTLFPRREITRRAVQSANERIWKCICIEACCIFGAAVIPNANRVLCWRCHVTSPLILKILLSIPALLYFSLMSNIDYPELFRV